MQLTCASPIDFTIKDFTVETATELRLSHRDRRPHSVVSVDGARRSLGSPQRSRRSGWIRYGVCAAGTWRRDWDAEPNILVFPNLDIRFICDFIEGNPMETLKKQEEDGETYYIIHPVLKHLSILKTEWFTHIYFTYFFEADKFNTIFDPIMNGWNQFFCHIR